MSSIENAGDTFIKVATVGFIGIAGYSLWRCYRKRGSLYPSDIFTCLVEGTGSVAFNVTKDLGKEIWGVTKPLANSINKSVLNPTGKWISKAGKTAFVDEPKKVANSVKKGITSLFH